MVKRIHAERSSVCMGDDCLAPNPYDFIVDSKEKLSNFLNEVAHYVPTMKDSVWEIEDDVKTLAYIIIDGYGVCEYKLMIADQAISNVIKGSLFCRYYYGTEAEQLKETLKQK